MDCPAEDFTFENIESTFFFRGEKGNAYPFVEVYWFDRGQDVQDKVATEITQQVRKLLGSDEPYIAVIFTPLMPSRYYDNGKHYG